MRTDDLLPLHAIPNLEGYKIIGVHRDGTEVLLTVKLNADNLHTVDGYHDLAGWRRV